MNIFRITLWIVLFSMVISGCAANTPTKTPGITVVVQTPQPVASTYPMIESPVPMMNDAYPEPVGGRTSPTPGPTLEIYTTQLVIPTPSSGRATVTGQLLIGGKEGQPYLSSLYLASAIPPSTPGYPPLVSHSPDTDPLAIQDVETGRFVFTDVKPGQYAIIVWNPYGGNLLSDSSDHTILFTVKENEIKDLGVIPIS